ncbi:MAG: hypothetical protein HY787_18745 [Deltaproteobacteria bacterium]|nr:hypothetical protein [Deltaproteobacteria bacterium]
MFGLLFIGLAVVLAVLPDGVLRKDQVLDSWAILIGVLGQGQIPAGERAEKQTKREAVAKGIIGALKRMEGK